MSSRSALTLLELITVLCILAALSGILIPLCGDQATNASQVSTRATLVEVERAIQQYWHDTKLVTLDGITTFASEAQRFEVTWLFRNPVTNDTTIQFDPNTRQGWNGPYLLASTVAGASPDLIDAWNSPLQIQYVNPNDSLKDLRIVSAGPNRVVDVPPTTATSLLTINNIGDDIYVAIQLR